MLPGVLKTNVSAVTLAAASTFPGLLLHLWEGLVPDTCLGMRRVGERAITINWQDGPVAGMAYAAQSLHSSLLSKACQQMREKWDTRPRLLLPSFYTGENQVMVGLKHTQDSNSGLLISM